MFSWTLVLTGGVKTDMIKHKSIVGQTCGRCVWRTCYILVSYQGIRKLCFLHCVSPILIPMYQNHCTIANSIMIWYVHCIMRPFNLISRKSVLKKQHYVWVQRTPLPVIWAVAIASNQSNSMICPYWFSTFVLSVGGYQFIFITRHLCISAGMKKTLCYSQFCITHRNTSLQRHLLTERAWACR